mgnify:FL=1
MKYHDSIKETCEQVGLFVKVNEIIVIYQNAN